MPAALPPMTSRQAKRLGKKTTGQFRSTASQMRRADRRLELEERRRKEQEKEQRKKENKRKREEQEEKERATKRRLLREGKITEEDTWGKVSASQPRLSTFFKAPATVKRPQSVPEHATHKVNCDGCDSQEETLVENNTALPLPQPLLEKDVEYISDQELLQLVSSQAHTSHPTPPDSFEDRDQQNTATKAKVTERTRDASTTTEMSKRPRSASPEVDEQRLVQQMNPEESFPDFEVAEDDTAEPVPCHLKNLNPPSTSRSALSEMSVANVNTRAQEKPDTTSAPVDDCGLQSPSKRGNFAINSAEDVLAMMEDADFDDEDNELTWDKENTDPLDTPSKDKGKQPKEMKSTTKEQPESSKKPATPGFSKFENCEDIFDFDFDTGEDDFDEDGVDDATLMSMAATQTPKSDVVVNAQGSPKKLSSMRDAFVKPAPLEFTPKKSAPRQPTPSKTCQPSKLSESFSSLPDEDLLAVADQVEDELSQKKLGKQKEAGRDLPTIKQTTKRKLPWVVNPLPPPNTQDYLLGLAEESEAEMEAE